MCLRAVKTGSGWPPGSAGRAPGADPFRTGRQGVRNPESPSETRWHSPTVHDPKVNRKRRERPGVGADVEKREGSIFGS